MSDLNNIYKLMDDEISGEFIVSRNITQNLIKIRDENKNPELSKKAKAEINCIDFYLDNGKLEPYYKFISSDGTRVEIPNLDHFDEDDYNYIKERIEQTTNNYLKSRYCMVIVKGKKDYKYAWKLINTNLSIIYDMKENIYEEELRTFLDYILNTYIISAKFNYKKKEIKSIILKIVYNSSYDNSDFYFLKFTLVELMLNEKRNFNIDKDLKYLDFHCFNLLKDLENKKMYYPLIQLSKLGLKLENKLKTNNYNWKLIIARTFENMSLEQENNLGKQQTLLKSIRVYKEIGDLNKVKELTRIFDDLKENIKLNDIKIKSDELSEILSELDFMAEKVSNENHFIILNELMNDYDYLVGRQEIFEELADNFNKKHRLIFDIPKVVLDRRGNILKEFKTLDERKEFALNSNYSLFLGICCFYLNSVIIKSIIKGNLTAQNLLDFIEKETWVGYKKDNKLVFKHLFYLVPIINNYFLEMDMYFKHPDYVPHFVLPMDTLILKIEGMIRDMCETLGISTTHIKNNGTEEKNLNLLLNEEKLEDFLGKDDIFFLKYLLIDKGGKNLRNTIAHSLVSPQIYNLDNMNLLILALFRIIKYELK